MWVRDVLAVSLSEGALFRRTPDADSEPIAIVDALESAGVALSRDEFLAAWKRDESRRLDLRWSDLAAERIEALMGRFSSHPIHDPKAVVRAAAESVRSSMEWRADALPTLDSLRESGYRLATVLGSSLPLGPSWERRVAPWIDVVLPPGDTGRLVPHPDVFRELTGRLGALPKQVLHVGEALVADVFGGRGAGLRTALLERVPRDPQEPRSLEWLRRVHGLGPEEIQPDLKVRTLEEIPVVLAQFG